MIRLPALMLLLAAPVALPEVVHVDTSGFVVRHETLIAAERAQVWEQALAVGDWWNGDHTISGDATRLSIDPRPMGCFCEDLSGGDGMVHLTVTTVSRNAMLRMTGGLGPLGLMGVSGNMIWEFFDDPGGTRVRFTYAVGGYTPSGLDVIAEPVDGVVGEALERLKARAEAPHD